MFDRYHNISLSLKNVMSVMFLVCDCSTGTRWSFLWKPIETVEFCRTHRICILIGECLEWGGFPGGTGTCRIAWKGWKVMNDWNV